GRARRRGRPSPSHERPNERARVRVRVQHLRVSALRVVGALFAVLLFVVQVRRYSRRSASRLNLIVTGIISLLVLLLAIQPNWFNPILSNFGFNEGNNQRLIGVLM